MRKYLADIPAFWMIAAMLLLCVACAREEEGRDRTADMELLSDQLPSAIFVTGGLLEQSGRMPQGVTLAIQSLNSLGVPVRLESRDILYRLDSLRNYNILILSTAPGYHDADRQYSLSYMSDAELQNIRAFVARGGTVIATDNVGRNYPDGTDRIIVFQRLDADNWPLAEVFGLELEERNMQGYKIEGEIGKELRGEFRGAPGSPFYTLVADSLTSARAELLANWINGPDSFPAIVRNRFGEGHSYLLASSDFLHPANAGGGWSAAEIHDFYRAVVDDLRQKNKIPFSLHPWPNAHPAAFTFTLNSEGEPEEYKRMLDLLRKENIPTAVFVRGRLSQEIVSLLSGSKAELHSAGYSFENYRSLNYAAAVRDILLNEETWQKNFNGFRFPYTMTSFSGLQALDRHGYSFESSIGANNLEFFHGAVFPYNLVISGDGYYQTTDILELAPVYHDDYHYLGVLKAGDPDPREIEKQLRLYEDYLLNYWEYAVSEYGGLMVYMGHPAYVGMSDTTLGVLESLIDRVQEENAWIASMEEVVRYRRDLSRLRFLVDGDEDGATIRVSAPPGLRLEGVSLRMHGELSDVSAESGSARVQEGEEGSFVVFDAFEGQVLRLQFDASD